MDNEYFLNKLDHIVILGTGVDALRCTQKLIKIYEIQPEYYIVNDCKQNEFVEYRVFECDKKHIKGKYVLVATSENTYSEIQKQLVSLGLEEFKDFIFYEWLFKKVVLLHGNCHLDVVESYLRSSDLFCRGYAIYPNPRICFNTSKRISLEVLRNVDLWIHEDIQDENGYGYFLSDSFIKPYIKESAIEIIIPHLFGLGKLLFPYSGSNKNNKTLSNSVDKNGMFPHSDNLIDMCVERGFSVEQIIEYCMSENAMSEEEVTENFKLYMDKIRIREEQWDIKIYDFIKNNYKRRKLFFDVGHPTNVIFKYIAKSILEILKINDDIATTVQLDWHEVPVYPTVKKYLHLEWSENEIRKSKKAKRIATKMDTEKYIREYLFWCYHMPVGGLREL